MIIMHIQTNILFLTRRLHLQHPTRTNQKTHTHTHTKKHTIIKWLYIQQKSNRSSSPINNLNIHFWGGMGGKLTQHPSPGGGFGWWFDHGLWLQETAWRWSRSVSSKSRRHETPNGLTKDPIKKDLTGGIYKASKRVCVFFCNGWWLEVVFSGGVPW